MTSVLLIHLRWRFLLRAAGMFAKRTEADERSRLAEETGHFRGRLPRESPVPELGGQDDHHPPPSASHFVGQIIAGDFLLDLVGAMLCPQGCLHRAEHIV